MFWWLHWRVQNRWLRFKSRTSQKGICKSPPGAICWICHLSSSIPEMGSGFGFRTNALKPWHRCHFLFYLNIVFNYETHWTFAGVLPKGCINIEDVLVVRQCGNAVVESLRQEGSAVCPLHLRLCAHLTRNLAWRHKYSNKKIYENIGGLRR